MKYILYTLLFFLTLLFYGCEKNNYFQSESSISKKIQKRWELVRVSDGLPIEDWIFSNGKIYKVSGISNDTTDIGAYAVRTSLSDAYVTFSNFSMDTYLNAKFTIERLDDEVFVIMGNDLTNGGNGIIYREFTAK